MTEDETAASGAPHSGIRSTSLPSKEVELAEEFEGEARVHRAMGDADEARKCSIAAEALRAFATPAVGTREEITKIIEFNCHRLAMIKGFATRKEECAKIADEIARALALAGEGVREALETIAAWKKVNIAGEYEHGLRDIIRSITDCAERALSVSHP